MALRLIRVRSKKGLQSHKNVNKAIAVKVIPMSGFNWQ